MGKLDEIKGAALNDDALNEVNGGTMLPNIGDALDEDVYTGYLDSVNIYNQYRSAGFHTSTNTALRKAYKNICDTVKNYISELERRGYPFTPITVEEIV